MPFENIWEDVNNFCVIKYWYNQGSSNCGVLQSRIEDYGEHEEHRNDGKHQPDDSNHSIYDSKQSNFQPDDLKHPFLHHYRDSWKIKTWSLFSSRLENIKRNVEPWIQHLANVIIVNQSWTPFQFHIELNLLTGCIKMIPWPLLYKNTVLLQLRGSWMDWLSERSNDPRSEVWRTESEQILLVWGSI